MNNSFEDILAKGEILYYKNEGNSMYPLIKEDKTILKILPKPNRRLKKGEIPLYKRDTGKYVLHRIIKVTNRGYYLRGDNSFYTEKDIEDRHIIGILDSIIIDGKELKLDSKSQFFYSLINNITYGFRYINFRFKNLLRKLR